MTLQNQKEQGPPRFFKNLSFDTKVDVKLDASLEDDVWVIKQSFKKARFEYAKQFLNDPDQQPKFTVEGFEEIRCLGKVQKIDTTEPSLATKEKKIFDELKAEYLKRKDVINSRMARVEIKAENLEEIQLVQAKILDRIGICLNHDQQLGEFMKEYLEIIEDFEKDLQPLLMRI